MIVSYKAQAPKMPFFVKGLQNQWHIESRAGGRSKVNVHLVVTLMPVIGHLMGPIMKLQMNKLMREALEEVIHFAQTGSPHARKQATLSKLETKTA